MLAADCSIGLSTHSEQELECRSAIISEYANFQELHLVSLVHLSLTNPSDRRYNSKAQELSV